ncbi:MAG: cysteine desulfurase [Bacteroidales bacterium]|nr:cysteine desulfurase [Bacteroidales bacterium]
MNLDIAKIRRDFPVLNQTINKRPFVYFDNAATSQTPKPVVEAIADYYYNYNSNVHRGVHYFSQLATEKFENTREHARSFINASESDEIIFTKGTTESINLVAQSFARKYIEEGDEIIITGMEHHSNLVPWQEICRMSNAHLRVLPFDENGEVQPDELEALLNSKTKMVAVTHISNTLGTILPVRQIVEMAHNYNVPVLIDGAQASAHMRVDVQEIGCDFYCFSSHKMFGPTGVGILYGKREWLEEMPPYQYGGEMIDTVTLDQTTFNEIPYKFEAGTPNIADVVAFDEALNYLEDIGFDAIGAYEKDLLEYATNQLQNIQGLRIIGNAAEKASLISFVVDGVHPYDMGTLIDKLGIAVRTGHHCAQPVMDFYGITGTIRASFAVYNTKEEIDRLVQALKKAKEMLM